MSFLKRDGLLGVSIGESYKLPVFYFLLTGAFASWQSFYNVHLDEIGFTSMQIGILSAIFISTSALVVPFWGILADKFGNYRILLLMTTVCAGVVFLIGETTRFPYMVFLIVVISIFHQPAGAVVDGMNSRFVISNSRFSFGHFRLWSSAGYAILSLVVGYLARQGTEIIFKVAAGMFLLLTLVNIVTLPGRPMKGSNQVNFKSLHLFFGDRRMLTFLVIILIAGIAIAPLLQFINLYYRDIGASESMIGWVFFVQAIPEIPAFIIGSRIVKRIGAEGMILLALGVSILRLILYGFTSRPEVAILFSIFHCITIAFFLLGLVEYVQARTPNHLRTTGQALIWAFHFGAGVTLGNILLGYLRDATGMLLAMHIHAAVALLVFVTALLFFRKK